MTNSMMAIRIGDAVVAGAGPLGLMITQVATGRHQSSRGLVDHPRLQGARPVRRHLGPDTFASVTLTHGKSTPQAGARTRRHIDAEHGRR